MNPLLATLATRTTWSKLCEICTKQVVLMKHVVSDLWRMSAVLSTFPWATDFLVKDIKGILMNGLYSVRICNDHKRLPYWQLLPVGLCWFNPVSGIQRRLLAGRCRSWTLASRIIQGYSRLRSIPFINEPQAGTDEPTMRNSLCIQVHWRPV